MFAYTKRVRLPAGAQRGLCLLALSMLSACGGGGGGATPTVVASELVTASPQDRAASMPDPATWLSCPATVSTSQNQPVTLSCERLLPDLVMASQWSLVSAPAGFTVPDTSGLALSFTATHVGEYRFNLRTTSGTVERVSSIVVNVDPPINKAPSLSCPSSQPALVGREVALTCTNADDGLPTGSALQSQWRVVSAPEAVVLTSDSTSSVRFTPKSVGTYRLNIVLSDGAADAQQDIVVEVKQPLNSAPVITCPTALTGATLQDVAISCTATDDGEPFGSSLVPKWSVLSSAGPVNLTGQQSFNARMSAATPGNYRLRLEVGDGELSSQADVQVTLSRPANAQPVVNCPPTLAGSIGQPVSMSCAATDDRGAALIPSWTVISGPSTAVLIGAGTFNASFTPTAAGSYRFRLSATDGQLTGSSDVVVTTTAVPVVVTCPATATGTQQQELSVTCSFNASGQPTDTDLTPRWSVLSSPAAAPALLGADTLTARVTPAEAGPYRLKFAVADGSAEVLVQVGLAPNQAPKVKCPSSVAGAIGQPVSLTCSATDDAQPAGVALKPSWAVVTAPSETPPILNAVNAWSTGFMPTTAGNYKLRFSVSDSLLTDEAEVVVAVVAVAPKVSCPPTATGTRGEEVSITCSFDASGQPQGANLVPNWSVLSAPASSPATVLGGANTLTVRFTPTAAGAYRLRLAVADGSADVAVQVALPPNEAPKLTCPATLSGSIGQVVNLTCSAQDDDQPANAVLAPTWTLLSGPSTATLTASNTLAARFTPTAEGTYRFRLSVSDGLLAGTAEVSVDVKRVPVVVSCPATASGTWKQQVSVTCTFNASGQPTGTDLTPAWTVLAAPMVPPSLTGANALTVRFTPQDPGTYRLRLAVADGFAEVPLTVSLPANRAPVINCPSSLTVQTGQTAAMTCSATDDGLPLGASLTASWSVVSAPQAVSLVGAHMFSASFVPTQVGTYVLRASITDSSAATTADVRVTVNHPPNQAPSLMCPTAVAGTSGQTVTITCTATDDSLPVGSSMSHAWTVISSPQGATLSGRNSLTPSFVPAAAGSYRLRLTTTDSQYPVTAEVLVSVDPPPNQAPVLTCPSTQNGLTGSSVLVQCSATDDGQPVGSTLTYSWSVVSAPASASVTLSNGQTAGVRFTPSVAGAYTLRLAVGDSHKTSTSDVVVTVITPPNQAPVIQCPSAVTGTAGSELSLACTAQDDGLPSGSVLISSWTLVSAPGSGSSWVASDLPAGRFLPSVQGTYQLRLTVSDGLLSSVVNVTAQVAPKPNAAPVISCATSVTGRINSPISVSCSTTDDGLPTGSVVSHSWSWVGTSGSPSLTVSPTNSREVKFVPNSIGTYRLRLAASDSLLQSSIEVEVKVLAPWRILPLGASIMNGYGGVQSSRYHVWKKLIDAQVSFDFVGTRQTMDFVTSPNWPDYLGRSFDRDHEGHSGFTAQQLATNLPTWMASYVPDVVFIHAGTNNVLQQGAAGIQPALDGLAAVVQALRARNPNVRVYVSQLLPVGSGWGASDTQTHLNTLNTGMLMWGANLSTTQSPVKIVTVPANYNVLTDHWDGLHPGALGEPKLGESFFNAMVGDLR
jgi:lysophospholipase L1-like esterase